MHPVSRVDGIGSGTNLACVSDPFRHPEYVKACMDAKITLLSMDMIPRRLSRAQSMDVNSSQDNLAGYKAVLLGAAQVPEHPNDDHFRRYDSTSESPDWAVVWPDSKPSPPPNASVPSCSLRTFESPPLSKLNRSAVASLKLTAWTISRTNQATQAHTPEFIQKVNDTVCGVAADADIIVTTARISVVPHPSRCRPAPLRISSQVLWSST